MPLFIQVLLLLSTLYYAWFILRANSGLRKAAAHTPADQPQKRVSVLIPARNEEDSIGRCLEALLGQDYPESLLEFIVIDDGSTDATSSIVSGYSKLDTRIRLLRLGADNTPQPSKKRGRKPEALARAISIATGEIIVTTDADCVSSPAWIRTLTSYLSDDVVYVVGPVLEHPGTTLPTAVRSLEVLGLISISGGRIGIGRPINGHGGNTAFLRTMYEQVGGFDFSAVKSDEETLLHEVLGRKLGGVAFAASPAAKVTTFSPPTLHSYWNQRLRWGSMHGRFKNPGILVELLMLYLSLLFPQMGLCAVLWYPEIVYGVVAAVAGKFMIDLLALRSAARILEEPFYVPAFIVGEIFHSLAILVVSTVAQFLPYTWKKRKVLAVDPVQHS